jgi:hypothetical protein
MPIDLTKEKTLPLSDVPNLPCIPRRRKGRKLHKSTVMRWVNPGLRGVRLEVIRVGGALCTSVAALQRFFERLAQPECRHAVPPSAWREQQLSRIDQELDAERL